MTQHHGRPATAGSTSPHATGPPPRQAGAPRSWLPRSGRAAALAALRLIAVAGLVIDAFVHLDLASTYAEAPAAINEGVLFRVEAVLALLAALALILPARGRARRLTFGFGFVIAASALALMLVSRYVDIGAFGPFPDFYDPVWFPEKLWAAFGEAAASAASLAGFVLLLIRPGLRAAGGDEGRPRSS
ncbi:MAG TPA: hypothetical protein VFV41_12360 [Streptosporangiaceae bacterium]|nr:hypothetical protein [Streptosporangiaceae bacterium]